MGLLALLTATAASAKPRHAGFTGDLGAGFASTWKTGSGTGPCFDCGSSGGRYTQEVGFALPSLSLGGFVRHDTAILGRVAGTSYFRGSDLWLYNYYGVVLEWWPLDSLFLSAGPGLGTYGRNPFGSRSSRTVAGLALDARVGVALAQGRDNDLTIAFETIPGFYGRAPLLGIALVFAWKFY